MATEGRILTAADVTGGNPVRTVEMSTTATGEGSASTKDVQVMVLGDPNTAANLVGVDAAGNLLVSITGRQPTPTTGTLTTATSSVPATVTNYGGATITVSGTHAGVSIVFEVSDDSGTTWYPLQVQRESDGTALTTDALATNAAVMYLADLPGVTTIRVRATAWTSGSAVVRISPGAMPFLPVVSIGNSVAGTGATTSVTSVTTTNTTLLAANPGRRGCTIFNDSTSPLFVLLGAGTESATVFSTKILGGGYYEVPFEFSGRISGHWTSANGAARITEFTA